MYLIIAILVVCAIFFMGVMLIDGNRFHIVEYKIESKKIIKNSKMVLLSDLHNKSYGKDNERLLHAIEEQNPEAILIAGDMLTSKAGEPMDTAIHLMQQLGKKYPIYYGMGNHESKIQIDLEKYGTMYEDYRNALAKEHIELMRNARAFLPMYNIDICGLELEYCYFKKFHPTALHKEDLECLIGKADKDAFQILIAHNPDYIEQYADWGADLVLSGHIHGGVMRLPVLGGVISPSFRLFPKYDGGMFREKNTTLLLSRGLGMHTIPIRIFNPGELIVIHLNKK